MVKDRFFGLLLIALLLPTISSAQDRSGAGKKLPYPEPIKEVYKKAYGNTRGASGWCPIADGRKNQTRCGAIPLETEKCPNGKNEFCVKPFLNDEVIRGATPVVTILIDNISKRQDKGNHTFLNLLENHVNPRPTVELTNPDKKYKKGSKYDKYLNILGTFNGSSTSDSSGRYALGYAFSIPDILQDSNKVRRFKLTEDWMPYLMLGYASQDRNLNDYNDFSDTVRHGSGGIFQIESMQNRLILGIYRTTSQRARLKENNKVAKSWAVSSYRRLGLLESSHTTRYKTQEILRGFIPFRDEYASKPYDGLTHIPIEAPHYYNETHPGSDQYASARYIKRLLNDTYFVEDEYHLKDWRDTHVNSDTDYEKNISRRPMHHIRQIESEQPNIYRCQQNHILVISGKDGFGSREQSNTAYRGYRGGWVEGDVNELAYFSLRDFALDSRGGTDLANRRWDDIGSIERKPLLSVVAPMTDPGFDEPYLIEPGKSPYGKREKTPARQLGYSALVSKGFAFFGYENARDMRLRTTVLPTEDEKNRGALPLYEERLKPFGMSQRLKNINELEANYYYLEPYFRLTSQLEHYFMNQFYPRSGGGAIVGPLLEIDVAGRGVSEKSYFPTIFHTLYSPNTNTGMVEQALADYTNQKGERIVGRRKKNKNYDYFNWDDEYFKKMFSTEKSVRHPGFNVPTIEYDSAYAFSPTVMIEGNNYRLPHMRKKKSRLPVSKTIFRGIIETESVKLHELSDKTGNFTRRELAWLQGKRLGKKQFVDYETVRFERESLAAPINSELIYMPINGQFMNNVSKGEIELSPEWEKYKKFISNAPKDDNRPGIIDPESGSIITSNDNNIRGYLYVGTTDGLYHEFRLSKKFDDGSPNRLNGLPEDKDYIPLTNVPDVGHSFDSRTFSFMPSSMVENAKMTVGNSERYSPYVYNYGINGPARAMDLWIRGEGIKRKIITGYGAGGQGYLALDFDHYIVKKHQESSYKDALIDDPLKVERGTTASWEINSDMPSYKEHLGYTFSSIKSARIHIPEVDGTITDHNSYTKAHTLFVGNGYGSQSRIAQLLLIDPKDGKLLRRYPVPDDRYKSSRGLSSPAIVKNEEGIVQYVYAGDLNGTLWRFDFTKGADDVVIDSIYSSYGEVGEWPNRQKVGKGITVEPLIINLDPQKPTHNIIVFGTGKMVESADYHTIQDVHYIVGIYDRDGRANGSQIHYLDYHLESEKIRGNDDQEIELTRVVSQRPFSPALHDGWRLALSLDGNDYRLVTNPQRVDGNTARFEIVRSGNKVLGNTDPCLTDFDVDNVGRQLELDFITGGMYGRPLQDANQDGITDNRDIIAGFGDGSIKGNGGLFYYDENGKLIPDINDFSDLDETDTVCNVTMNVAGKVIRDCRGATPEFNISNEDRSPRRIYMHSRW